LQTPCLFPSLWPHDGLHHEKVIRDSISPVFTNAWRA